MGGGTVGIRERGRRGAGKSGREGKRGDEGRKDDPKWTPGLEWERASPSAGKGPADGRTTWIRRCKGVWGKAPSEVNCWKAGPNRHGQL